MDPGRRYAALTLLRGSLVALSLALGFGFLAALYTVPRLAPSLQAIGLDLRQLRPLHDTFASVWTFLGSATLGGAGARPAQRSWRPGGGRWRSC